MLQEEERLRQEAEVELRQELHMDNEEFEKLKSLSTGIRPAETRPKMSQ